MRRTRTLPPPVQQSTSPSLMVNTIDNKRVVTRDLYLINESGLCPGGNTVPRFGPDGKMLFSTVTINPFGSMIVPHDLTVGDNTIIAGSLDVITNVGIGGDLTVQGNTLIQQGLGIGGDVNISGGIIIYQNLTVDSDGTIGGDLTISGDTVVHQGLTVDGYGLFGSDLSVSGDAIIYQNLVVGGDTNISGDAMISQDLIVAGIINGTNIQVNGFMNISGDLTVDRIHVLDYIDDATHVSSVNTDKVRALEVFVGSESLNPPVEVTPGYQLDVSGSALVRNTMTAGNIQVTGAIDISGQATLQDVTVGGTLDVSGQATFNDVLIEGDIDVSGQATFNDVLIEGDIDVSGQATFNGVLIEGTLDVSGQATLQDLRVEGELDISGPMVFKNTVTVWGYTDLCSNLAVAGSVNTGGNINVTTVVNPAIAVNTPSGRRGGMYWNTVNDRLTFDTAANAYPIELQGSEVKVTSSVSVNDPSGGKVTISTPAGTYGNIGMNGYFNAFPTGAALTGKPNFQIASDTLPIASIYNDQPYANRATNPLTTQFQIAGNSAAGNRLCLGTYYTTIAGTCGTIQASDNFSGLDHGANLLLNPLGGSVGINKDSVTGSVALDVSGSISTTSNISAGGTISASGAINGSSGLKLIGNIEPLNYNIPILIRGSTYLYPYSSSSSFAFQPIMFNCIFWLNNTSGGPIDANIQVDDSIIKALPLGTTLNLAIQPNSPQVVWNLTKNSTSTFLISLSGSAFIIPFTVIKVGSAGELTDWVRMYPAAAW